MSADPKIVALARLPEYDGLSDAEAAALAAAPSVAKTDATRKGYVQIAVELGDPAKVTALDAALKTAGLEWVQRSLGGAGLDFTHALTISAIDGLATAQLISGPDAAALKALGVWHVSPYADLGGEGTPTAEMFAEARAFIGLDEVRAFVLGRYNDVIGDVDAGIVTTVEAARVALGAAI